jgi:outer membrane murein-binding lipoprotein Lpp
MNDQPASRIDRPLSQMTADEVNVAVELLTAQVARLEAAAETARPIVRAAENGRTELMADDVTRAGDTLHQLGLAKMRLGALLRQILAALPQRPGEHGLELPEAVKRHWPQ